MTTVKSRQAEVRKLLTSLEDPDQRKNVAQALASSNSQLAIKTLSRALALDDPVLRLRALEMIEIIAANEKAQLAGIKLLIQIAQTDPDWGVRRQSTAALGNLKAAQAIPLLIQRLIDDDPRVHEAAIDALRSMADKSVPYLQLELNNSNPPLLKWRCIEVLKILGLPNLPLIQQLIPFINHHEPIIRDEARAALESFRPYFYEDLNRIIDLFDTMNLELVDDTIVQVLLEIILSDKDAFKLALKNFADVNEKTTTDRFVELIKRSQLS